MEHLLKTKLFIPPLRPALVTRPRLIERLNEGLHRKLTLVSAPAGFGKTTLISEWVQAMDEATAAVAWLSLDESDNDPTRFLIYLLSALQTINPNLAQGELSALQSSQPLPTDIILTSLINEVAAGSDKIILILDDFHRIESQPIYDTLSFLLEHLPPQLHLVIATREDPDFPLSSLRAKDQLTELRAADLRFTRSEVADFFNHVMEMNLTSDEIEALETRTEGWIASLQMAALSMQKVEDTTGFIQDFTGSHHFVLDYLVDEVLQRQTEEIRRFLLQTSILDRLCSSLCNAVTGHEDSKEMLENLERGNLFVVPLDEKRQWYRYHHLFADVLKAYLMDEQPNQLPVLHRRASEWYERNDQRSDAIHHALVAEDDEWAAGLIELAWPAMDWSYQSATWLKWAMSLPDDLIRTRPVLSVGVAWALLNNDDFESSEDRLRDAEEWIGELSSRDGLIGDPATEMVVVDKEQFRSLPGSIAAARAYRALAFEEVSEARKHARKALELLPEGDHQKRGQVASLLGLSYWATGELEEAHRFFTEGMSSMRALGNILDAIGPTFILAEIRSTQGRLHEAKRTYHRSLKLVEKHEGAILPGFADLYLGLSELHREQGDLEVAEHLLQKSENLGVQARLPDWSYRHCLAKARLKQSQGELESALDLLHEAERLYNRTPLPVVRPVAAMMARVWAAQDRLTETQDWVRERGLSAEDDLGYLSEFEHITLARVLIAQHKRDTEGRFIDQAVGLLERLLKVAEEGGRMGSAIEILVQLSLAHQAHGDTSAALMALKRALALADPEGYVRIFVEEGPSLAALLREVVNHGADANYVGKLLGMFVKAEDPRPVTQPLIDPLSERELEVLRLLRTELNGPEIARELSVSLNTMRTHTKNIYNKLGANNRRKAVRRAEELDLL